MLAARMLVHASCLAALLILPVYCPWMDTVLNFQAVWAGMEGLSSTPGDPACLPTASCQRACCQPLNAASLSLQGPPSVILVAFVLH